MKKPSKMISERMRGMPVYCAHHDLTLLFDALPYLTHHNAQLGKGSMGIVMLGACMKNLNVT